MQVLRQWLALCLLAASPAYAGGVSGTYVGQVSNGVSLLQIVETAGGQLTGRYEQTLLQAGGKLDQLSASITGAVDGQTVVVTIKLTDVLASAITASGTIEGSQLHLSGSGNGSKIDLTFSKAEESAYRSQVAGLTEQARRANEARAQAERLARLNEFTKNMLTYSEAAGAQLAKFPPIEHRYHALTEWMTAALTRQQLIFGGGQASLARGEVGLAINQAGMEAAQLHSGLQGSSQEIIQKIKPVFLDADKFGQQCRVDETPQSADLHSACLKFVDAAKKFKASRETLGNAFDRAEKVWVDERRKQEGIIQASTAFR